MGKFFAGIMVTVAIILLLFYLGLISFGPGGKGEGQGETSKTTSIQEIKEEETRVEEKVIQIEVKKDIYLVEGEEVTLSRIKEKVTEPSKSIKVTLVNHYASTKAWDELKSALMEWGIEAAEE